MSTVKRVFCWKDSVSSNAAWISKKRYDVSVNTTCLQLSSVEYPSFLDFAMFSSIIFTRFAETLSFVLEL